MAGMRLAAVKGGVRVELLLLFWLGCGIASMFIASSKGRSGCGWAILGFLLGPIGLLGAALASPDARQQERAELQSGRSKKCPYCGETVKREAIKCRHCGEQLPPNEPKGVFGW